MKTTISLKKPEDSTKILENIRKLGNNKQCFDCGEKVSNILNVGYNICCNQFWYIRMFALLWNT